MEESESKKNIVVLIIVILAIASLCGVIYYYFSTIKVATTEVNDMYSKAKLNSFVTEVKSIFIESESQFVIDEGLNSLSEVEYGRSNGVNCAKSISLSIRNELNYYIKVTSGGKTTSMIVSDGTYSFEYNGEDLNINEITSDKVKLVSESNVVIPTCK